MDRPELCRIGEAWNQAMRRGDYAEAWRQTDRIEHERRALEAAGALHRAPHHLTWNGSPFDDQRVLVRCTHGLGDTLQFVRYIPPLTEVARSVTLLVQPLLLPLFADAPEFGDVRNGWSDETPPHDLELEIMELSYAFRSTVDTLPRAVPYLPLRAVQNHSGRLPPLDHSAGLRVGLLWASSDWDTSRSIPLQLMTPLGRVPGVRFYSLQQGREAERWHEADFELEPLSRHTQTIPTAAAAMCALDLVITPDSMAAHLAGALGVPVWVLLQHEADWRWMEQRTDSPWYPTMRLYRQPRPGDWVSAIEAAAAALDAAVRRSFNSAARH